MMITLAMAYAVTTHEVSSIVAPRFPLISLKATFTMEISINSMMAAEMTVTTMIARVKPVGKFDDDGDDIYFTLTSTSTLRPAFKISLYLDSSSNSIFTGTRCVIFTKLPVALSGGSNENLAPVAKLNDETFPLISTSG